MAAATDHRMTFRQLTKVMNDVEVTKQLSQCLLPCPFCGGQFHPDHPKMATMTKFSSQPKLEELTGGGWRVNCYGCGVQTWNNLNYTREQAVIAWNTRTPMFQKP